MVIHKRSNHRDWPGLPDDILLRIVDKVKAPDDYARFGAVCRPWRSVFLEHLNTTKPPSGRPLPLLLVAAENENAKDRRYRALYSISTGRVSNFRLPLPRGSVCRGSSFGWLFTLARHDCSSQLYNPFLSRTVDLPRWILSSPATPNASIPYYYLHKAVLSSDPYSSPHFVVMAIMSSRFSGLAFCRAGDRTWTPVGDWWEHYVRGDAFYDVVFVRKTNQFCASLKSGRVVAVDCNAPKLTQIAPPIFDLRIRSYLVEDSSGDLLQVCKNFEHDLPPGTGIKLTWSNGGFTNSTTTIVKFTVFKLDAGEWIEIHEIGHNVMFLGNNASMLLPASDCPGCEPNCIYYTDDDDGTTHHSNFSSYGPPADGVYSLKDGVARPHYSSARSGMIQPFSSASSDSVLPQAIWLQPTLRGATI